MNGFAARYADDGPRSGRGRRPGRRGDGRGLRRRLEHDVPDGARPGRRRSRTPGRTLVLPIHFWIDTDGIVRDGALGGIGPDIMATASRTILPGVTVTSISREPEVVTELRRSGEPSPVAVAIRRARRLLEPARRCSSSRLRRDALADRPGSARRRRIDPLARSALRRLARVAAARPDRLRSSS